MYGWDIYESYNDIQIIPEDEEELHDFDFNCSCRPKVTKRNYDNKIIYAHASFYGRQEFEKAEETCHTYHPLPKYTKDC